MVLSLVLGVLVRGGEVPEFGPDLARWSGGAISRLPKVEQSKFIGFVKRVLVKNAVRNPFIGNPWFIFESHGDAYVWPTGLWPGYVVLLNPHTGMTPSAEHAWLFVVDEHGAVKMHSDFDTGWRMYAKGATLQTVKWLSSPVVVQEMEVGINGDGPRKIFIALDNLRPAVVRLEDETGHIRPMAYWATNWVVGPKCEPLTVKVLTSVLLGANDVKRLEALVWLAGQHARVPKDTSDWTHQEIGAERLYLKAIKSAEVADAVKGLRASSNEYVSKLALRVPIGVGNFDQMNWRAVKH